MNKITKINLCFMSIILFKAHKYQNRDIQDIKYINITI